LDYQKFEIDEVSLEMTQPIKLSMRHRTLIDFYFSEVSVADVIGTPSVCKVRVFRTPGQIISLTSDFSFVSFTKNECLDINYSI
jgi:hypothetical protein